jgi:hypothetical protein
MNDIAIDGNGLLSGAQKIRKESNELLPHLSTRRSHSIRRCFKSWNVISTMFLTHQGMKETRAFVSLLKKITLKLLPEVQ